ncbi:MAG: succinylglutamate desuccinylase/aspartoacylase family protein [Candidatus Jordarchaeaceae archaeon]
MFQVGTISAFPGERVKGFLKVAELSDGSVINVPLIVVNGIQDGPIIWIQCAIHGNEVEGSYALIKTIKEIDPKKLRGILIGIPVLNVTAFWSGVRIPIFDNKDLNRIMPGKQDGSFAEQYAYVIYKTVKEKVKYFIDVHSAGRVDWALYNEDVSVAEESKELAKSSGFDVIVSNGHGGELNGALFRVLAKEGIPSIILESKNIDKLHNAYMNILKHLKMIDGTPTIPSSQKLYKGFAWREIVIRKGGLFCPLVEEGEKISKGQLLGIVSDVFGDEVEKIFSPVNGLVLLSPGFKPVKTGDTPFEIAIE